MKINKVTLGDTYRVTDQPDLGPVTAVTIVGRKHPNNPHGTECIVCDTHSDRGDIIVNPAVMELWKDS